MISLRHMFDELLRRFLVVAAAFGVVAVDTSAALAQNQNCAQLISILRGIERNESFRSLQGVVTDLRAWENQVRQAESQWVRNGCQSALNSGQALSQQCRSLAQDITSGRRQVQDLTALAREGQSLAQNRERLLQDYARFNCGAGQPGQPSASLPGQTPRGSLLDQLFGGDGGYDYVDTPYDPWSTMATRRTVCVRTCDGYYWPISFSTVDQYIGQDAISCHEMCPGTEVLLFSYRNPGEEPEDMISISGVPYTSMPYAFRYRTEFNKECSCQPRPSLGSVAMSSEGQQSRAVIDFGEVSFPMPRRDQRGAAAVAVAEAIHVPLPRPRPREDGTGAPAAPQPVRNSRGGLRLVDFGDKQVRVVGPQTPFAPEAEGGS